MTGYPWTAWAVNLGVTAVAVAVVLLVAYAVGRWRDRHDGLDIVWGLGFVLVALLSAGVATVLDPAGDGWRRILVVVLVAVWGGRLAWHIGRRNHGRPQDRRYTELAARGRIGTRAYLVQGVVLWLVSLPVQLAMYGTGGTIGLVTAVLGTLVWLVGFGFEAVGDAQLARFTADPANRGHVLDTGLWRYTRHPNYFGDACVWWGLGILALHHPAGLIGLVGVAAMTVNLVRGTGAAMLERDIADRRPAYADYVRRTSGFLPLPPREPNRSGV
ncbi:DUF1295 domain-containing protein [Pseudonocardia sp. HH130630-07]|uniref:DUF1295 domain-containing protein n=1 Tax=Pseudonocardia sp. HH130630-07 TaxID=1690815 RepID=UPI000814C6AA|nr:DUF1295 domain-containing protein [Pseudonocardia sp. HH130630-07]ANY08303.1 hypothetical protein AFB00_20770 [Pseudonocardia sp. HH130630-07]